MSHITCPLCFVNVRNPALPGCSMSIFSAHIEHLILTIINVIKVERKKSSTQQFINSLTIKKMLFRGL